MAVASCPSCGKALKVRDETLGQRIVCPGCKQRVVLARKTPQVARGWFYARDRKKQGPVSFADLQTLAQRGVLMPSDPVLADGASKWVKAQSIPNLFNEPITISRPIQARRSKAPLLLALAATLMLCGGLAFAGWILTRPPEKKTPADTPIVIAQLPETKQVPPPEVKKADPPEEKKVTPPEEKKADPPEEKKVTPPEEKKADPPEEKKVTPPEEKKADPPEEKKPVTPEDKKTPPEDDFAPKKIDVANVRDPWLERFNTLRMAAGLGRLTMAKDLLEGCQAHAEYLVRNRDHTSLKEKGLLEEDAGLPGFSREGQQAAVRATVALEEPMAALEQWLARLDTRLLLLDPGLRGLGVGVAQNQRGDWACVIVPDSQRDEGVVLYPYPGQKDVRLSFSGGPEISDPKAKPGFPVSAQFGQNKVTQVEAWLVDEKEVPVPFWLSTPAKPLRPALDHMIGIVPKSPLLASHTYTVKFEAQVDGKPWSRTWSFTTEDDSDAQGVWAARVLERVNHIRKEAKTRGVVFDPELSKGCRLHAMYLVRNAGHPAVAGLGGHEEDPKLPGYSPEGHKAGKKSVIAFADVTPIDAVEAWLATLYHRIPLLEPRTLKVGFGAARGPNGMWTTCLDLLSARDKGDRPHAVFYPEDGQVRVPLNFPAGGEVPDPIPDDKDGKAGFPITAFFPDFKPLKDAQAKLLDAQGNDVAVWFSAPEKPANPKFATNQGTCVCLIPHDPLAPEQTYRVEMSGMLEGKAWERKWSFTTGAGGVTKEEAARRLMTRLNRTRAEAGLSPIRLDPANSKGCQEHAEYVARNFDALVKANAIFNDQDAKFPGATPAGRDAARSSQVSLGTQHPDTIVDDLIGTLSMREYILEPGLRRIGFGCALTPGRGWMNVYRPITENDELALAMFPHAEQTQVPTKVRTGAKEHGPPLTLWFLEGRIPPDVRVRLTSPDGKDLPLQPAATEQKAALAFVPPALVRETEYQVEVRYTLGTKERRHAWKFITAP